MFYILNVSIIFYNYKFLQKFHINKYKKFVINKKILKNFLQIKTGKKFLKKNYK